MAGPLAFLPYALAAYGGYKGYKASKDAGGSGLQRLLGGATGAYLGYQGGKMVPGVSTAGFGQAGGIPSFSQLAPIQSLSQTAIGPLLGLPQQASMTAGANPANLGVDKFGNLVPNPNYLATGQAVASTNDNRTMLQKLLMRSRKGVPGEYEIDPMKAAFGIGALTYASGAFEPQPQDVFTPTYNLAVAELQRQRGGFKYIDPVDGTEKTFEQPYIPEANPANQGDFRMGPYAIERNRLKEGGLAEIRKFNEGGINYLPSKRSHSEDDANNYVRASGYVEDGSGTGDKDEDTMLAQLADGEFVTRADGVLGAGIIAGGNPNSMKDMREKGAQYFYEQQKRYKRVFDLLEGSRNAKAQAN
jgi:hypothetical protein